MSASIWNPEGTQSVPALPAANPVTFIKGTSLAPGINFVGDTDTGIWSQADGYINFTVNGVTKLVIDPAGNIIGNKFATGAELDLASAATCDIGNVLSNSVRITGNSAISSFGNTYRGPMFVRFAGTLILSNSANLICPGGASINVAPGDTCIVVPKASAGTADGWVVVSYQSSAPLLNAVTSINTGQLAGMRNRIINGDCRIAQRGNIGLVNNTRTYGGADRFSCILTGFASAVGTLLRSTGLGGLFLSGCGQSTAGTTTTGVGNIIFRQCLEAVNVVDLAGKAITISGVVFQDSGSTLNCRFDLSEPTVVDNYAGGDIIAVSNLVAVPSSIPTLVTFTVTLTAAQALKGLALDSVFFLTGAVTNKNFIVGELQVELGSVATPFERRSYGTELALCQRYFEQVPTTIGNSTAVYTQFPYKVTKRSSPILSCVPALTGGGALGSGGMNGTYGCRLESISSSAPSDQIISANAEL
jgi:hypothetical protein